MTATRNKQTGKFVAVDASTGVVAAGVIAADTDPIITAIGVPWTAIDVTDSLVGYQLASEWADWPLPDLPEPDPEVAAFECPVDHQRYYSATTDCTVTQDGTEFTDHEPTRVVPVSSP